MNMNMNEIFEKARNVKSEEELLSLAKEHGIQLTEESAKAYYHRMHQTGEISDPWGRKESDTTEQLN